MDVFEVRFNNFVALSQLYKKLIYFYEAAGLSESYGNQLYKKRRKIGEKTASKIEKNLKLAIKALDDPELMQQHFSSNNVMPIHPAINNVLPMLDNFESQECTPIEKQWLQLFRDMPDIQFSLLMEMEKKRLEYLAFKGR